MLLINLHNTTTAEVRVAFNTTWTLRHKHKSHKLHRSHVAKLRQGLESSTEREAYHLTAKDGNIQSQTMLLNGNALRVDSSGTIPSLNPVYVNASEPIVVGPSSIVFAHIPYVVPPACR